VTKHENARDVLGHGHFESQAAEFKPSLEDELHPELNVARIAHCSYLTKSARGSCDVDGSEVRVIENIESLATEL